MLGRKQVRYSEAFKVKIVEEIEKGVRNLSEVRKVYGIGGDGTVEGWLEKLGRGHLINKVVRVETREEKDRIKALEKRNRMLEKMLVDRQIEATAWKMLVEVAEEYYGLDIKKNSSLKLSQEQREILKEVLGDSVGCLDSVDKDITKGKASR